MTTRLAVTGADGFLGWHLRCLARTRLDIELVSIDRRDMAHAATLADRLAGVEAVVHLAGVNRGSDDEIAQVNPHLAEVLAEAVRATPAVGSVVYANSVHASGESIYGRAKAQAATILRERCGDAVAVADVRLPNLFGEHGRPYYNSFVATFCQDLAVGQPLEHVSDSSIALLHAQEAAGTLLDAALSGASGPLAPEGCLMAIAEVAHVLGQQADSYASGVFPDLGSAFEVRLFNQLRSYAQPFNVHDERESRFDSPRRLPVHADERGGLAEIAKALGGQSQTFFSTTRPGVTRGNHFHTRKVERFVVVRGDAEISLRRVASDGSYKFTVSGELPVVVDIPTLHTHAITNVGDSELLTLFWTDEVFDPSSPDTYPEPVRTAA